MNRRVAAKGRCVNSVARFCLRVFPPKELPHYTYLMASALRCVSRREGKFAASRARTQIKRPEYFSFGHNAARKSVKNLPRNAAVAISACRVTQVPVGALQERDIEGTKVEIRGEE